MNWRFSIIFLLVLLLQIITIGMSQFASGEPQAELSGWIIDDSTNLPISGVAVIIDDGEMKNWTITNSQGHYTILCESGMYSMEIRKSGYEGKEFPIVVEGPTTIIQNESITKMEEIEVEFEVCDSGSLDPINNVSLLVKNGNNTIVITTDRYGKANTSTFPTTLHISIVKENYITQNDTIIIEKDGESLFTYQLDPIQKVEDSYSIGGYIAGSISGMPITNAKINIVNEQLNIASKSDNDGFFSIPCNKFEYTLFVSHPSYVSYNTIIPVQINDNPFLIIEMEHPWDTEWGNSGVGGFISVQYTQAPMSGVTVHLVDENTKDDYSTFTNELGYYEFITNPGEFSLTIDYSGYSSYLSIIDTDISGLVMHNISLSSISSFNQEIELSEEIVNFHGSPGTTSAIYQQDNGTRSIINWSPFFDWTGHIEKEKLRDNMTFLFHFMYSEDVTEFFPLAEWNAVVKIFELEIGQFSYNDYSRMDGSYVSTSIQFSLQGLSEISAPTSVNTIPISISYSFKGWENLHLIDFDDLKKFEFLVLEASGSPVLLKNPYDADPEIIDFQISINKMILDFRNQSRDNVILSISNTGNVVDTYSISILFRYYGVNIEFFYNKTISVSIMGTMHLQISCVLLEGTQQLFDQLVTIVVVRSEKNSTNQQEILVETQVPQKLENINDIPPDYNTWYVRTSIVIIVLIFLSRSQLILGQLGSLSGILYSRLKKDSILNNDYRRKIISYLEINPGTHYSRILRDMGMKNGVFAYHLGVLEDRKMITRIRFGQLHLFYPRNNIARGDISQNIDLHIIKKYSLNPMQIEVLSILKESDGLVTREIAEALNCKRQNVNYHLRELSNKGLITGKKESKTSRYHLNDYTIFNT